MLEHVGDEHAIEVFSWQLGVQDAAGYPPDAAIPVFLAAEHVHCPASACFAAALGVVLGVPDQIFATLTQYAFVAAVAVTGVTATAGAAVLQRRHL